MATISRRWKLEVLIDDPDNNYALPDKGNWSVIKEYEDDPHIMSVKERVKNYAEYWSHYNVKVLEWRVVMESITEKPVWHYEYKKEV